MIFETMAVIHGLVWLESCASDRRTLTTKHSKKGKAKISDENDGDRSIRTQLGFGIDVLIRSQLRPAANPRFPQRSNHFLTR